MPQAIFGPKIGAWEIKQRLGLVLTERLPTYLAELADRRDAGTRFPIRWRDAIIFAKDFKDWPEARVPCIQVKCSPEGPPRRSDDGLYADTFRVEIYATVSARDRMETDLWSCIYADAIDWCISQHQSLKHAAWASGDWHASGVDRLFVGPGEAVDVAKSRTLQDAVVLYNITVEGAFDKAAGPAVFIPDPGPGDDLPAYPDDPTVAEDGATFVLNPVAPDEEL